MKISASIYSSKDKVLTDLVHELDAYGVDYFHIDCNDNHIVFEDIKTIRSISSTPIDLHLITDRPEDYLDAIVANDVEHVTFQFENIKVKPNLSCIAHCQVGLAITSDTPVEVFKEYENSCSFILFMTTTPGKSGGEFNRETFKKIRQFRNLFPGKKIHVDGGINEELSFILRNMGVDASVIGSFLFKGSFMGSAFIKLKSDNIKSHYSVSDFMMQADEIPVISYESLSFENVLQSIEQYRLGFTNVIDQHGRLMGIISNADIRRALIKNLSDLNNIKMDELINYRPALVYHTDTVSDVLKYIKSLQFPVLFLPVINKDGRLAGTIKFNNLIKGES